jgi:hypothetical protein
LGGGVTEKIKEPVSPFQEVEAKPPLQAGALAVFSLQTENNKKTENSQCLHWERHPRMRMWAATSEQQPMRN